MARELLIRLFAHSAEPGNQQQRQSSGDQHKTRDHGAKPQDGASSIATSMLPIRMTAMPKTPTSVARPE